MRLIWKVKASFVLALLIWDFCKIKCCRGKFGCWFIQRLNEKRTFRYYNFWLLRYGILTVSPASSFSSRTCFIRQNGMFSAIEKIIVSKGSFLQYTLQLIQHLKFPYLFIRRKSPYQSKILGLSSLVTKAYIQRTMAF